MYIIRFEKESLNDYILYNVDDEEATLFLSESSDFQITYIAYPNDNNLNIKLYFKIIIYNKNINYFIYDIIEYINNVFKTEENDWTIFQKEYIFNNEHIINLYFYSNKYYTTFMNLKKIVDSLYFVDIEFDDSIYYRKHKKYTDYIVEDILIKNYYKLFMGTVESMNVMNIDNLNIFIPI